MTTLTTDSQRKHITKQSPFVLQIRVTRLRNGVFSSHTIKDEASQQSQPLILNFLSFCSPATEELNPYQGAKNVEGTFPSCPHSVPPLAVV